MLFHQFFLEGLAHASYLVGCETARCCAVVDPQRDIDLYLDEAQRLGLTITHTFLTHLHADYVAGHCELAARTGAAICIARAANAQFEHLPLDDARRIAIGSVVIQALATPGHTPESMTLAVYDSASATVPTRLLTGDTLFIGDVGRVDLLGPQHAENLARQLHDSLFNKLLKLPDEVEVYPGHGAGSLCARVICDERSSTLGRQRRENYALNFPSQDAFIRSMVENVPETPAYFIRMVRQNRQGPRVLGGIPQPPALSARQVQARLAAGAVLVDTRPQARFAAAHVPGAYSIGAGGGFSTWAGSVLGEETAVLLLAEQDDQIPILVRQLVRVGCDRLEGYLAGGIDAWAGAGLPLRHLPQISADELRQRLRRREIAHVVDVRNDSEWNAGHIEAALHIPVGSLPQRYREVPNDGPVAVICAAGYRSSLASSILLQRGYDNVTNVMNGMNAWNEQALPLPG
ncbi:MAG: MBL fold metallo-hydrolase [Candidatus Tectomicrobia bacterium]|nr:MBL fold metallo-hydrolase [Candidatus Tectomicrobia bacterium]